MNITFWAHGVFRRLPLVSENRHHGLQLAAAVVIAYFASTIVGLPERFWAVMSVLIVMRSTTGGTFSAGWDRVFGTMVGAVCGLLGVYAEGLGANVLVTTLVIVATLAFASAAVPAMRSAAVAALIILTAGDLAGHSALQAAALRVAQIVIGVGVAVGLALISSKYRAAFRLDAGCAALLRGMARRLRQTNDGAKTTEIEAENSATNTRRVLGRLALLAGSADQESRIFRRSSSTVDRRHHGRIAGLMSRIFQDVTVLNRVLLAAPQHERLRDEAAQTAAVALATVADFVLGAGPPELSRLRKMADDLGSNVVAAESSSRHTVLLAAPLHLLLEDLQRIVLVYQKCKIARPPKSPN